MSNSDSSRNREDRYLERERRRERPPHMHGSSSITPEQSEDEGTITTNPPSFIASRYPHETVDNGIDPQFDIKEITGPLFDEDNPPGEDLIEDVLSTKKIPSMQSPRSGDQEKRDRFIACLDKGYKYLRRQKLRNFEHLSRNDFLKPDIFSVICGLESVFSQIRVLRNEEGIQAYSIRPELRQELVSKIRSLIAHTSEGLVNHGTGIPKIPRWGRDNRVDEWWNLNDFEVLCASYRQEVEAVLKILANVIPRKPEFDQEEPSTPRRQTQPISAVPQAPSRERTTGRFWPQGVSSAPVTGDANPRRLTEMLPASSARNRVHTNQDSGAPDGLQGDRVSEDNPFNNRRPPDRYDSHGSGLIAQGDNPPSDDGGDSSDDGNNPPPNRPRRFPNPSNRRPQNSSTTNATKSTNYHFDMRLKPDHVPSWDGNSDTLARWVSKLDRLARSSVDVHRELGKIVPRRLEDSAEAWYYSIPESKRDYYETDWTSMKEAIAAYWMNYHWLQKQKIRATRTRYREPGQTREMPSEYVIRKLDLISLVYSYNDQETIQVIMEEAPDTWATVLNAQGYRTIEEFQNAVKYHEDSLAKLTFSTSELSRLGPSESRNEKTDRQYSNPRYNAYRQVRSNLVGWSKNTINPTFPKDDRNVSSKATPESKGARPCRHCGSGKHWDNECKHARQGERRVRANLACLNDEDEVQAQANYDELYYGSDSEEGSPESSQDFCEPLQSAERQDRPESPIPEVTTYVSKLEGNQGSEESPGSSESNMAVDASVNNVQVNKVYGSPCWDQVGDLKPVDAPVAPKSIAKDLTHMNRGSLNRRSRRRLAKDIERPQYTTSLLADSDKSLIEMKKYSSRPPGCSFLGSKATQVEASINSLTEKPISVIVDSGSDITLISQRYLQDEISHPKIKQGQRINLVQVTGNASISGFVDVDLYFHTPEGPVKIAVEAYVVKGMSTPFILGNDFADQYSISVMRNNGASHLIFGNSGRSLPVESSTSPPFTDDQGHAFKVNIIKPGRDEERPAHRKRQKFKRKQRFRASDSKVRSTAKMVIPPETCIAVPVAANFPKGSNSLYVEKTFSTNRNTEDIYAPPDSLISKDRLMLHVANFSTNAVTVQVGQVLGTGHNPNTWLDRLSKKSPEKQYQMQSYATLVKRLAKERLSNTVSSSAPDLSSRRNFANEEEDPLSEPPLEGGPKIFETPDDPVDSSRLLEELDINKELSPENRRRIEKVVVKNKLAFGLDDRLGHLNANIQIPLKPEAKEVSLPPFPGSPASRQVIDDQMDKWFKLGVIEASKSPWAAPAFIVYRNGKPRMVVDYRKLNEVAISDEFPLPKQDDILQALTGAQWLTTLDALAGFTQLDIDPKERPKLAFRTHRGLHQFVRMPFGYKNGPSIFQRVMQNILAPFLWIFALVYIDDIVVYSKTFDDHVSHLDQIFAAIQESGITLSTKKCHLAYQSLLLLGQKVSRLGLSTHKEKVDAIINLETPRNVHTLQTFLGMMVYFSAYVPFYAWMAAPLFGLLKKGTPWVWTELHDEAFELCKQVLTNAPVRGYACPGLPYRLYTDACDFGLAGILQQVQRIQIRDLKGTKVYERCQRAFESKEPVPNLVVQISKADNDVPENGSWAKNFEDTWVHVERVIAYWSRVLKPAEKNYSATEREALALKEALIKFQPYIEGETILAITDHAALTWSTTFQNVNRRLLTWGTVFSGYPKLRIVHRAGRVHSNVDPISRLRRRVPIQDGPTEDATKHIVFGQDMEDEPLRNMYEELGDRFEEKLLTVASNFVKQEEEDTPDYSTNIPDSLDNNLPINSTFSTSNSYSVLVGITDHELGEWKAALTTDNLFGKVLKAIDDDEEDEDQYPQYHVKENNLIYFEDWNGNHRLCVPNALRVKVMSEVHDTLTESAHGGYAKTYNRIAATYYWPKMSRDIKRYVSTCDICQKSKPRRHGPVGLLQPIPIPSQPFEVVTMDFIPELPTSEGYDNVLVIVDKLTKYAIFIPTTVHVTEKETAKLFFEHVITHYGIPRQVITDRDTRWRGDFWKEICTLMGMKRSLTTAYHPQADGQTEVMNQGLEISLRAYIGPNRDDWSRSLNGLALAYNSTPHTATNFAPAYLLRGYHPITGSTLLHSPEAIPRPQESSGSTRVRSEGSDILSLQVPEALDMVEMFQAERQRAQEALMLGQQFQKRAYNRGRLTTEFKVGDLVLFNPHSLSLLKDVRGRGRKLLMKYDGPFEVIRKISPVSYQLRLPASYGMHPILNIAHLERYEQSPPEFGKDRPTKSLNRDDFEILEEFEVERIVSERYKKGRNGRRIIQYLTRFKGYDSSADEWLTSNQLRNAPEVVAAWRKDKSRLNAT